MQGIPNGEVGMAANANWMLKIWGFVRWLSCIIYKGYSTMVLYGVYYGAYTIANFYISAFSAFHYATFFRRKDYISEFPYILTILYEFYMNVDMQVICCTVTSALSLIFYTCT